MASESKTMQPLRMRRDYDEKDTKKESVWLKKIPIQDYDEQCNPSSSGMEGIFFTDYDNPQRCKKGCFLCDR